MFESQQFSAPTPRIRRVFKQLVLIWGALIADLDLTYAGIGERLLEDGALRRFINVYINDEDVRFLGGLDSQLKDGDSVTILPAVAGG